MKKFKSPLEKILQLRKFKEEECKLALGQAISVLNMIENEIIMTAQKRQKAACERFTNVNDIIFWENYIKRLDMEAETLAEKAAQAQLTVDEKRNLYLEAQKDLKTLEKLKEKQKNDYRKVILNNEILQVDDITSARYNVLT